MFELSSIPPLIWSSYPVTVLMQLFFILVLLLSGLNASGLSLNHAGLEVQFLAPYPEFLCTQPLIITPPSPQYDRNTFERSVTVFISL